MTKTTFISSAELQSVINKRKIKPIFLAVFLISSVLPVFAQKNIIHFASYNTGGLIIGSSRTSGTFQTVNGISGQKWYSGIGAGVDYYYYRTVPVFIDGKYFFLKENKLFVYGDIGLDIPWKPDLSKSLVYYDVAKFHTGVYTDAGIGFRAPVSKRSAFLFSIGYSYKNFGARIGTRICGIAGCSTTYNYSNLSFEFSRIILKMGLVF